MKKSTVLAFALASFFVGCDRDDAKNGGKNNNNNNDGDGNNTEVAVIPIEIGNYWEYDVLTDGEEAGSDYLFVEEDVVIGSQTYKKFQTTNQAVGFYSGSLSGNAVRKDGNKLLLTGEIGLGSGEMPIDLNISVTDFVILNLDADNEAILSEKSDVISETIEGYPMTINYTLKSVAGENLASYTIDGRTYANVKVTKMIIRMKVTAVISPIPFPIPVLDEQDVIVSTSYFAKGVGVVHTKTDISFNLNETIAEQMGVPAENSQNQEEILKDYKVD